MIYHNDAAAIHTHWQGQIDESLEAGEALLLEIGVSTSALNNLGALVALERLAAERFDVTSPLLAVGGDGVTWAAMLLSSAAAATAALSPAITPVYAGADQSTYLASLATLPGVSTHIRYRVTTGLPVGMHSLLMPASQPGVTPLGSALPLVLVAQAASNDETVRVVNTVDPDPWLQWLTLLMVVGLFIVALFI